MKKPYAVEFKTNTGHLKWVVYATSEQEAKVIAIKEVLEQMEIAAYKVTEVHEEQE
jgi:hypothetical protein